jgi:predicted Zn-dependent protease
MLCRFTHGVIMFKIGLITQARTDFELIYKLYPKEYLIKYNYALTLFQLGLYKDTLLVLEHYISEASKLHNKEGFDFQLLHDVYQLKA